MKIGVVIGHFNCLNFLELNLYLLNKHNKNIKILVSDDNSNSATYTEFGPNNIQERLINICNKYDNVELHVTKHLGHQTGDFYHFKQGIDWAIENDIEYLCKLSQRCILDEKDFLSKEILYLQKNKLDLTLYKSFSYTFFMLICLKLIIPYKEELILKDLKGRNVEEKLKSFFKKHKLKVNFSKNKSILHRLINKEEDYNKLIEKYKIKLINNYSFYIHAPCKTVKRIDDE